MNILLVTTEFPPSDRSAGIGSYNFDLANKLVLAGHSVTVLTSSDKFFTAQNEYINGIFVKRISFPDYFIGRSFIGRVLNKVANLLLYNLYRIRIARLITLLDKKFKYDLVEFPEYGDEGKYWWRKKHIPSLVRFHGPSSLNRFTGRLVPNTNRQFNELRNVCFADGFSFVSSALRDVVFENLGHTSCPSYVVHNSVDVPRYISEKPLSNREYFSIVGAGSVGAIKGWDLLYSACETLRANNHDVRLTIYGRLADLGDFLSSKAETCNWIKLQGHISRDALFDEYRSADLCCFPSRFEPMGLTALEAMGSGGLVLAGNFGGWKEAIKDTENGFLFDPNLGSKELAENILRIKKLDRSTCEEVRKNAQRYIADENSHEIFVEKVTKVYEEIKDNDVSNRK